FFNWLEANINNLAARNEDSLVQAIKMSCEEKAAIVSADEKETGIRVILNLGHTFGHAIEAAMGYGSWLHGEAVATGMLMAADLSCRMRKLSVEDVARIKALLIAAGLPVVPPEAITKSEYLSLMSRDKKNVEGSIRFVLLEKLGKALVTSDVDPLLLDQTLQAGTKLGERLGEAPSALT
ncbi:3-dehydroquinate synthase, partial [Haliea sp. AH-315-K21]|nr:3-dehydroquinate synthase [Haliea sp. AH-315-K21]